jgi:hypothetical protein
MTATASAGCLDLLSSDKYVLHTTAVDRGLAAEFVVDDPLSVDAETRIDYDTETKREWVAELFETGSVTAVEWPLVEPDPWGDDTRPRPTFLDRTDGYYAVRTEQTRQVERERWTIATQRTEDDPPSDATVESDPLDSLSERDTEIFRAALDAVYAGNDGFLGEPDIDGLRPVQYHQDVSVADSELVPDPPFEYIDYYDETYRVIAKERTVTVPERTFTTERISSSRTELEAYVRETVPDARFENPSDAVREVLDTAVTESDGMRYEENPPLSEELSTILDALGIGADLRPIGEYEDRVDFQYAVAAYEDDWYLFNLLVDV